ncbi:MAG TPA: hypothetical protein VN618_13275 [Solirubrobacteraceae bacterium]|nr:hypothetical protein [Solirubrobacteraceae bacterium]
MVRIRSLVVLLGTVAVVASASASSATAATVELRKTELGEILVDSQGFTLFEFSIDSHKMDRCVAISGCTSVWPPLTVSGTPTAGPGLVAKKLKTIVLPSGVHQVIYGGHPLYGYAGNTGPGQIGYIGANAFGGYWYGVNAKGGRVR